MPVLLVVTTSNMREREHISVCGPGPCTAMHGPGPWVREQWIVWSRAALTCLVPVGSRVRAWLRPQSHCHQTSDETSCLSYLHGVPKKLAMTLPDRFLSIMPP